MFRKVTNFIYLIVSNFWGMVVLCILKASWEISVNAHVTDRDWVPRIWERIHPTNPLTLVSRTPYKPALPPPEPWFSLLNQTLLTTTCYTETKHSVEKLESKRTNKYNNERKGPEWGKQNTKNASQNNHQRVKCTIKLQAQSSELWALRKVKTTKTWKGTHKPHEKPHGNIADQAINHLKALAKKQAEERNAT